MINATIYILLISITVIFFLKPVFKGLTVVAVVTYLAAVSSFLSFRALGGTDYSQICNGTIISGSVNLLIDPLSAWFILVINFTFIAGSIYGFKYMESYKSRTRELTLHSLAFIMAHFSLIGIAIIQNGFFFLIFWEIMALSLFLLLTFEHNKGNVIKAGLNYLIQSHVSLVFLMLGFIYSQFRTGSFSFEAITQFASTRSAAEGLILFLCFFTGFAIKAGFVPFHTWLPYAHPAAPSHISGIMSGVVIKIGIYGIFRFLLLIKPDFTIAGYLILAISVVSGIYGVMLAIIQHDLKKLLAYHSIENIGIIGIGIGVGCIGMGSGNKILATAGFTGALLHTLNHSLFKSLLFYTAGNVYKVYGSMDIEKLGGVIRKMPHTALLFLLAAVAICGLPPLNGFISEFIIYGALFEWLKSAELLQLVTIVMSVAALSVIGGLALFCFTKAFGVVFLGTLRGSQKQKLHEVGIIQLLPLYAIITFMFFIALFPSCFTNTLYTVSNQFTSILPGDSAHLSASLASGPGKINIVFLTFIFLVIFLYFVRSYFTSRAETAVTGTWGCAYPVQTSRMQYTAGSFARNYAKIARPVLEIGKSETETSEIFPGTKHYKTWPYDKLEKTLIDRPIKAVSKFSERFAFLQNGQLQSYILYGIIFIGALVLVPVLVEKIMNLVEILKRL